MRCFLLVIVLWLCSYAIASDRLERYTDPADIVLPGMLPWAVYISDTLRSCSAVLASNKYLLTSAHCLDQISDSYCLKANFRNAINPFSVKAKRYLLHPKFNNKATQDQAYDFALIELDEVIDLQEEQIVSPRIDSNEYDVYEVTRITPVYAAGYDDSEVLKKVELTWLSLSTPELYLLSYDGHGKRGDSGGPLFYSKNNTFYLLGIHDSGDNKPGGLIGCEPISKYLYFIFNNTNVIFKDGNKGDLIENWKSINCHFDNDNDIYIGFIIGLSAVSLALGVVIIFCKVKKKIISEFKS